MENNTPNQMSQIKVPATYMRGGTSKGVFFNLEDLPSEAQVQVKRVTNCCCELSAAGSLW